MNNHGLIFTDPSLDSLGKKHCFSFAGCPKPGLSKANIHNIDFRFGHQRQFCNFDEAGQQIAVNVK